MMNWRQNACLAILGHLSMSKTIPYNSKWQTARLEFLRTHPLCVMCQAIGRIEPATAVDHIIPHRMKEAKTAQAMKATPRLFWDRNNWQGLCASHHNSTKQRMEKTGKALGVLLMASRWILTRTGTASFAQYKGRAGAKFPVGASPDRQ
jgi:5-methylcytosine-specific restriction protein A